MEEPNLMCEGGETLPGISGINASLFRSSSEEERLVECEERRDLRCELAKPNTDRDACRGKKIVDSPN